MGPESGPDKADRGQGYALDNLLTPFSPSTRSTVIPGTSSSPHASPGRINNTVMGVEAPGPGVLQEGVMHLHNLQT